MFTREECRQFRNEINEVLGKYGKQKGLNLNIGSIRFGQDMTMRLTVTKTAPGQVGGEVRDRYQQEFDRDHHIHGFEKTDLGKKFDWNGNSFTLHGILMRSQYPIIAKRVRDGKLFKLPLQAWDKTPAPNYAPSTDLNVLKERIKMMQPDLKAKLDDLSTRLSPEWLTCDGELSNSQVRSRRSQIMREWKEVERRAGFSITPDQFETIRFENLAPAK